MNSFVSLCVETITGSTESFELLSILNNHSDQVYADSVAASMYSVLIAQQLGFESAITKFKLCTAGLFHDIGKKELDQELLLKPRALVTKAERQIIESHVVRGFEILNTMKSVPPEVARMIYEHHEDQEGQGYPFRKVKKDQHPLSKILQCTSVFIENINSAKSNGEKIVATKIIDHIEKIYEKRLDSQCILALKNIFSN